MTSENAAPQSENPAAEEEGPDALGLSALLSSRVCHDLINPVGAIGSGLDVLDDPEMDEAMRGAALDLIRSGATKALALLSYARLAYGAAGGFGAEISMDDAREALDGLYATLKPDLVWEMTGGMAPKDNVKAILILANAAADCVPRGGTVTIAGDIDAFTITAVGKRIYLQDDLVKALGGEARDLTPKFTPALIAAQMIVAGGGAVDVFADDEKAVIDVRFSGAAGD